MKLKEPNKEKASKNHGEAKAVDTIETYDLSVQKAAALLASKKHSSPQDRQALVKSVLDSGKEMADYIVAHAPGR